MAKKYDGNKVYAELQKLTPREQAIQLKNISEFVKKNLEVESSAKQEEADDLQKIIQTINGN